MTVTIIVTACSPHVETLIQKAVGLSLAVKMWMLYSWSNCWTR